MKIGERGQVTIPKDVREKYGLLPNIEVEFVPEESGVLLRKRAARASPVEKVYGILNKKSKADDIIEAWRGHAERIAERLLTRDRGFYKRYFSALSIFY